MRPTLSLFCGKRKGDTVNTAINTAVGLVCLPFVAVWFIVKIFAVGAEDLGYRARQRLSKKKGKH